MTACSTATIPTCSSSTRAVVARREHEGRPAVVLDRTAFYAESGGQPWDTGTLGGVPVRRGRGGRATTSCTSSSAPLERRRACAAGWTPTAGATTGSSTTASTSSRARFVEVARAPHRELPPGRARSRTIDLDRAGERRRRSRRRRRRANEVVWEARPVTRAHRDRARRPRPSASRVARRGAATRVRSSRRRASTSSPAAARIRARTSEVGVVAGRSATSATRAARACASSAATARSRRSAQRGAVLRRARQRCSRRRSTALPEAGAAAAGRSSPRRERRAARPARARARRRGAPAAGRGARRRPPVVVAVYDGWPPADLRALAQHLVALAPCVALLGSRARQGAPRVRAVGRPAPRRPRPAAGGRRALGGRGGGKRRTWPRAAATALDGLDEALVGGRARVRGTAGRCMSAARGRALLSCWPSPSLCVSVGSILVRLAAGARRWPSPSTASSCASVCSRPSPPRRRGALVAGARRAAGSCCSSAPASPWRVHFATWIASLSYTSVAASVLLVNTAPLFTLAFSRLFLRRARRPRVLGGHGLALGGRGPDRGRRLDGRAPPRSRAIVLALAGAVTLSAVPRHRARPARRRCPSRAYVLGVWSTAAATLGAAGRWPARVPLRRLSAAHAGRAPRAGPGAHPGRPRPGEPLAARAARADRRPVPARRAARRLAARLRRSSARRPAR